MQNSISSYEMDGMDVVITKKGLLASNVIARTTLLNMYMNVAFSWGTQYVQKTSIIEYSLLDHTDFRIR